MHLNKQLKEKTKESMASVLPITAIVFLLSITIAPLDPGTLVLFLFGAILLIGGMGLFTLGVDMSMTPMGEGMGVEVSRCRHLLIPVVVYFVLGVLSTVAEPDLQVLAEQVPAIENLVLILTVAVGVGIFLVVAFLRVRAGIPLRRLWCSFTSSCLPWRFLRRTTSCRCPLTLGASPPALLRYPLLWLWAWASPLRAVTKTRPATASAWWRCAPSARFSPCCCWALSTAGGGGVFRHCPSRCLHNAGRGLGVSGRPARLL